MTMFGNILVRNEKLMDKWKQTFFLSWGLLRQGLGEMEEALNWLEGAADVCLFRCLPFHDAFC